MRRVIICGSRHWTDPAPIARLVAALPSGTVVITGGARGVAGLAHQLAQQRGLPTEVYPAAWATEGRQAGPRRNARMLSTGVYAFRGPARAPITWYALPGVLGYPHGCLQNHGRLLIVALRVLIPPSMKHYAASRPHRVINCYSASLIPHGALRQDDAGSDGFSSGGEDLCR